MFSLVVSTSSNSCIISNRFFNWISIVLILRVWCQFLLASYFLFTSASSLMLLFVVTSNGDMDYGSYICIDVSPLHKDVVNFSIRFIVWVLPGSSYFLLKLGIHYFVLH